MEFDQGTIILIDTQLKDHFLDKPIPRQLKNFSVCDFITKTYPDVTTTLLKRMDDGKPVFIFKADVKTLLAAMSDCMKFLGQLRGVPVTSLGPLLGSDCIFCGFGHTQPGIENVNIWLNSVYKGPVWSPQHEQKTACLWAWNSPEITRSLRVETFENPLIKKLENRFQSFLIAMRGAKLPTSMLVHHRHYEQVDVVLANFEHILQFPPEEVSSTSEYKTYQARLFRLICDVTPVCDRKYLYALKTETSEHHFVVNWIKVGKSTHRSTAEMRMLLERMQEYRKTKKYQQHTYSTWHIKHQRFIQRSTRSSP